LNIAQRVKEQKEQKDLAVAYPCIIDCAISSACKNITAQVKHKTFSLAFGPIQFERKRHAVD
jgi:hypothetical protein